MPKLNKPARGEAMPAKIVLRTKAAIDIDVPIASSYWRDQCSVQPSLKTIINFDQMTS